MLKSFCFENVVLAIVVYCYSNICFAMDQFCKYPSCSKQGKSFDKNCSFNIFVNVFHRLSILCLLNMHFSLSSLNL